jgi:hypothetical protein
MDKAATVAFNVREGNADLLARAQALTVDGYATRVADLAGQLRRAYANLPVSKAEWDAACGEP